VIARYVSVLFLTAAISSTSFAQQSAAPRQDTAASRAEVLAVVTQLFDGMRKRDTAAMRAAFHPGASLLSSSERNGTPSVSSSPIDSWISSIATAPPGTVLDERLMNTVVRVQDGLASVWTEYEFWAGERFSHCGVDAILLGKTASGWKVLSIADTRQRTGCKQTPSR
jgi:hypothetical protein